MIIDFHSHILPGIDDGSQDPEMSAKMLAAAKEQGINVMVATPHFYADRMRSISRFIERRERAYHKIEETAQQNGIRVICGAEVAFFSSMSQAEELDQLCIGDTKLLMVEMPFRPWTDRDLREIELLTRRGIHPIMAHIERFYSFQKSKRILEELFDMDVAVQVNAEDLLSWRTRHLPVKLFKSGVAQLLGSDSHNLTDRAQNLAAGRAVLEKKCGRDCLEEIDSFGAEILNL